MDLFENDSDLPKEFKEDGQTKCERCGSTEISLNVNSQKLRCHWCRHEQEPVVVLERKTPIEQLKGQNVGIGASSAKFDSDNIMTLACTSCSAEVVVDTSISTQSRCHWCRNTLSINNQVPSGAVPDKVLPFMVKKNVAREKIEYFVSKRKFYADKQFKFQFCTENIMGVYMPYMVIDANVKGSYSGDGELLLRWWTETRTVGSGKNRRTVTTTYYDADRYTIARDFDMTVEGLTIESNSEKLQMRSGSRTNNIINAIKPFDMDKARVWDANFMTGYTAQKRDTNVDDLQEFVDIKLKDIARHNILDSVSKYDRGVRWKNERLNVIGKDWKAVYAPIWLYSYQSDNGAIHYVAVNGQTEKTMGSVPINTPKLALFSFLISTPISALITFFVYEWLYLYGDEFFIIWAILLVVIALIYWFSIKSKYRNKSARFEHEKEAMANIRNLQSNDVLSRRIRRSTSSGMSGDNRHRVDYKGS